MDMRQAKRISGIQRRTFLKATLAAGAAAALGGGLAAPALGQSAKVLRFGHMLPETQTQSRAIHMFADELAKLSSNKIKVEIFPSSQLGSITEMMQSVQAGSLSVSMAVPAWYSTFAKPLDAFTLPYLVASVERLKPALDGEIGADIAKYCDGAGFKVVGTMLLGGRHIVNKVRAVHQPADCKGLKLRVINSQVYMQTYRALGAVPVAMDPSELYLALQQGVVDGFEFPLPDLLAQKMYEVSKYLALDQHTTDFFILSTGKKTWASLAPEEQKMFDAAMKKACDWQWQEQPRQIDAALTKLRTLLQVNDITPAEHKLFVDATKPVYAEFAPSIGQAFLDKAIKALG
jgi:C4-dicarboxylate-binding protein DctP